MALKGTEQGEVWGGDIGVFGPKGGVIVMHVDGF